jgi:hypothetical protein
MSITIPSSMRRGEDRGRPGPGGHGPAGAPPAVVYLAAARNTYGTVLYRLALRRLSDTWPGAVVMDADACGFASRADWQLRWPFIREGIDGLVVLCESDGTVSQDTFLELRDATDLGLPCWLVAEDGALAPVTVDSFRLHRAGSRSSRRWAHAEVVPGT